MSYTDWRDWALGEGAECPDDNEDTWRRVAENANCDARHENPNVQPDAYRNDLGDQHPTTKKQFNDVCRNFGHQLTGAPVEGPVPDVLARCVKRRSLKTQVNKQFETEKRGGRNFRWTASEDHEFDPPSYRLMERRREQYSDPTDTDEQTSTSSEAQGLPWTENYDGVR